jgi:hypothetical protein
MRRLLSLIALAAALVACNSRHFVPATPPGFVDIGENYPDGEYRAATADGVVLGIRNVDNEPKGELAFWARALENQMRESGGYALLDKRSVTNRGGGTGAQLRFGHDEDKTPHLYWVTLFVTDKRIFILEAGGTKEEMEKQAPQIEWAIRNFLPK